MKLYTRILRFFLRDLYARTEAARTENMQTAQVLQEARNQSVLFQESAGLQIAMLQEKNLQLQEELYLLRQQLAAANAGQAERAERSEKRLDCLEHYRSETELRMHSDDRTTLELAHRLECVEQAIRDGAAVSQLSGLFDKKTYSQAGEDAVLVYACAMLGIPFSECNYLDLGANKPVAMSNTFFFYQQGARGVLLEANPALLPALQQQRAGDIVLHRAVTGCSGDTLPFHVLNLDGLSRIGDISDILEQNPEARLERTVPVQTISVNDIIRDYFQGKAPVILNLDIEGLELEILESIDFTQYRPLFFIIEMIPYSEHLLVGQKQQAVTEYMQQKQYAEYAFTGINSVFIDKLQYEAYLSRKESA